MAESGGAVPGEVAWIVVFGFPVRPDGRPTPTLARRIAAAVVAARRHPEARLLVSGGPSRRGPAEAEAMRAALLRRGVAPGRIVADPEARDTMDTVRAAARLTHRGARVLAVSSRYHVPRCVALLRLAGLRARGFGATPSRREPLAGRLYWPLREPAALLWDAAIAAWLRLRERGATGGSFGDRTGWNGG